MFKRMRPAVKLLKRSMSSVVVNCKLSGDFRILLNPRIEKKKFEMCVVTEKIKRIFWKRFATKC